VLGRPRWSIYDIKSWIKLDYCEMIKKAAKTRIKITDSDKLIDFIPYVRQSNV